MGYRVEKLVEAKLNKIRFTHTRSTTVKEIHQKFNENGIPISYKGLVSLINGQSSWSLTYAMMLAKILELDISYLFELEKIGSGDPVD